MNYIIAQPNEKYFLWQIEVQLENFREKGIELENVYYLVGDKSLTTEAFTAEYSVEEHNRLVTLLFRKPISYYEEWNRLQETYGCTIWFIPDTREPVEYVPSIRPHIIAKFFAMNEDLANQPFVYVDADIIFLREPEWEGMLDGRIHATPDEHGYFNLDYIRSKQIPELLNDMLNLAGVTEAQVDEKNHNTCGIQYLFPRTTPAFWEEVERVCTAMYQVVKFDRMDYYRRIHYTNYFQNGLKRKETYEEYKLLKQEKGGYDFQIWCADLFAIWYMIVKYDLPVYANPALSFTWSSFEFDSDKLFMHNSGVVEDGTMPNFMLKQEYREGKLYETPFEDPGLAAYGLVPNKDGQLEKKAQRHYIDIIEKLREKKYPPRFVNLTTTIFPVVGPTTTRVPLNTTMLPYIDELLQLTGTTTSIQNGRPLVSCVMTTYGRHTLVERAIACFALQTWDNKELIIYNTAKNPYVLGDDLKDSRLRIKIINNNIDHVTHRPYDNVGAIRRDATVYAEGKYYICWDDDDLFLPWHIEQGISYLNQFPEMKAYMPKKSFFTEDGGKTWEYAQNSMEASCIVEIAEIREYGFHNSNGAEHLSWRMGLRDRGLLKEDTDVYPLESYAYVWGDAISPRKQSGHITNPNNFVEHKLANQDFREGGELNIDAEALISFFPKLIHFVNNIKFTEELFNTAIPLR